jgi:hypothetical protein
MQRLRLHPDCGHDSRLRKTIDEFNELPVRASLAFVTIGDVRSDPFPRETSVLDTTSTRGVLASCLRPCAYWPDTLSMLLSCLPAKIQFCTFDLADQPRCTRGATLSTAWQMRSLAFGKRGLPRTTVFYVYFCRHD